MQEMGCQIVRRQIRKENRNRYAADIEADLQPQRLHARIPDALYENSAAANRQSFRETQFSNAKQDEKEVHRHRSRDAGQTDFQTRGGDRNRDVAEQAYQIL